MTMRLIEALDGFTPTYEVAPVTEYEGGDCEAHYDLEAEIQRLHDSDHNTLVDAIHAHDLTSSVPAPPKVGGGYTSYRVAGWVKENREEAIRLIQDAMIRAYVPEIDFWGLYRRGEDDLAMHVEDFPTREEAYDAKAKAEGSEGSPLSENEEKKHVLWDKLVNVVSEETDPLMPLLDFIARVYNAGLANVVLEYSDRVSIETACQSLKQCVSNGGATGRDEANQLLVMLLEFASTAQHYKDEYRASGEHEDEEDSSSVMDEFDQLEETQEIENWIYDDSNMNPIFERMIECSSSR